MNLELKCRMPNGNLSSFYFRYGQLESKMLGGKAAPVATLKYLYRKDGMIVGRVVDGKYQMYKYDKHGQLLQVADMQGNVAEKYVYDPAGNILSKTVNGKTTTYTYDKANQLVSSECGGKVTKYQYDAAGRLIQEGDKSYSYGWLDKVLSVTENGQKIASFNYHNDGQIAQTIRNGKSEDFLWDGLALIHRGETSFINEPYVTGGNPILSSKDGVMFNDMLGSTLNIGGKSVSMTSFGESADNDAMYTGKPYIGELGYAFLFRNYRADQGKWQTTDPLGYPDGWNNLAYGNNQVFSGVDLQGTVWVYDTHNVDFEATTMKDFSSGNGYYIVTFPTPDWWYMVIYQVDRAQYIEQMVQASCPHADPYKYTAPDNSYNVSVNVSWVKSVYSYGDAFNGNGGLINVDVYSVVSTWRVKGTYQTRRWVEE